MSLDSEHSPTYRVARRSRIVALRIVLVLTLLLSGTGAALLAGPPRVAGAQDLALATAEAAPADTVLYATLNADPRSDQLVSGQNLSEAVGGPAILDFLGVIFEDNSDNVQEFGETLAAFGGGEVAIAVSGSLDISNLEEVGLVEVAGSSTPAATAEVADEAATVSILFIVRAVNPDDAYRIARDLVESSAQRIGEDVTVSEYHGTSIESVVVPPDMPPDLQDTEESPLSLAVAEVDDFVLIAELEEDLYAAIDTASGEADNLADQQPFADVREHLAGDYLAYGYADGSALEPALASSGAAEMQNSAVVMDALQGYTGLRIWADESAPGFRFDTVTVPAEGAQWEAGDLAFDTTLDERVPGSTAIYAGGYDFGDSVVGSLLVGLVADLMASVTEPSGLASPAASATAMLANGGAAALREVFSGEYAVAVSVPGMEALADPSQLFILVTSGVSNEVTASAMVAALDQVIRSSATEATTFEIIDFQDSTIYQASNDDLGVPIVVQYGVVDGQLVIGAGETLRTFFSGVEDPLSENPQYIQTFDTLAIPGDGGGRVYIDLLQIGRFIQMFDSLASGSSTGIVDAAPDCAEYANQAEAQAAYEEDPFALLDLDQDFDGEACEDYFTTPASGTPVPTLGTLDLSGLVSYGQMQYEDGDVRGSRGLLLLNVE